MSQYSLIVATLREFDLITEEQQETAIAEWERVMGEIQRRKLEFRDEWYARRAARPWWRRIGDAPETEWMTEWYDREHDVVARDVLKRED